MKLNIFCDFDGTITEMDTTDAILEAFASPEYRDWEVLWEQGLISGRECMERQTRLIRAHPQMLRVFCQCLPVDVGIYEIENACLRTGSSLMIVSDEIDFLMEAVLTARGLGHIPHRSNRLGWDSERRPFLAFPFGNPNCRGGCGVCKCKILDAARRDAPAVYIGDGLSDSCAVHRADRVFAKNRLREYCRQNKIRHEPFATLSEVARSLFDDIYPEELVGGNL